MKIPSFFSRHILRPNAIKQGRASELVLQLRKINNHYIAFPTLFANHTPLAVGYFHTHNN